MKPLSLALCLWFRPYRVGRLNAATNGRYNRTADGFVDGDEQDKKIEWLNSQKQGQHHIGYSTFGCGGPIKEHWRCNGFAEHICCYGSDIHN